MKSNAGPLGVDGFLVVCRAPIFPFQDFPMQMSKFPQNIEHCYDEEENIMMVFIHRKIIALLCMIW